MSIQEDIASIRDRDPAARSDLEVLLAYPGLHAVQMHRLASRLYAREHFLSARLVSHLSRFLTGIEIHPGAKIGERVFIDHGMGVVIGETAEVGDDVMMYQGVTLGGTGKGRFKRHPTIESGVTIGVGAKVLGAVTVGEGAKIGGGSVVLKDVPPHTTAVGVPARAVAFNDPVSGETRPLESLPDPQNDIVQALMKRVEDLELQLKELKSAELNLDREMATAARAEAGPA